MPLFILGINHNTAPVDIREKVVFDPEAIPDAVRELSALEGLTEAMVLSTCNRTEIIGAGSAETSARAREWLANTLQLDSDVQQCLFELANEDAARHMFRVAAGLDSVVLGEPQIGGQLKEAFRMSQAANTAGPELEQVCQHAFSCAKQIRTETAIGESPVSVAYAAVKLAGRLLGHFDQQTALLIGGGETVRLVARHLGRANIGRLFVANRTQTTAEEIAAEHYGLGMSLDSIDTVLDQADIIVASTRSPEPVIRTAQMALALKKRRRRQPVFVADIAVPRDIDAEVAHLDDVYLYTVDDLNGVITDSLAARQRAAMDAEEIIDRALERYNNAGRTVQVAPLIRSVREHAERIRNETLEEAQRRAVSRSPEEALSYLANTLTSKLMHGPTDALRRAAENEDQQTLDAARRVFGLGDESDNE